MTVVVLGAGAFGTALAIALGLAGRPVTLWTRDARDATEMARLRQNPRRLPGAILPASVTISAGLDTVSGADAVLLAIPMQSIAAFLTTEGHRLSGLPVVACAKGMNLETAEGPTALIGRLVPGATPAILTGPSFAADIARGLPTALTLATADDATGERLQAMLSTPTLRLYRTTDTVGAEVGGALKNVIAIAAGVAIGAGLGDSARAALVTRGFAEMTRLAAALGGRPETLSGLSGLGDLILTCTSAQSRNFGYGMSLGRREGFDPAVTVEGRATSVAAASLGGRLGLDVPVTKMVAALSHGRLSIGEAVEALLARPLRKE
jgi:glycerol-3-phosphate dehydrogenase (NAD(P)+)